MALLARVAPLINENDAVSFTELTVGDNDKHTVAALLPADLLVLLTTAGDWCVILQGQCEAGSDGEKDRCRYAETGWRYTEFH